MSRTEAEKSRLVRDDPTNLIRLGPAKGGIKKIKHSFCGSAFCFGAQLFFNIRKRKGQK